jgi:1-acyl-sn-glycerol-3-phosphate acyltransferase
VTALPDLSGVPHPPTWPFYPHRWVGRLVIRRRFAVVEHGTDLVPVDGPVIFAANHVGVADGPLLGLFGPRPVHVLTKLEPSRRTGRFVRWLGQVRLDPLRADPRAVKTCLRVLAEDHAVGIFPEDTPGAGDFARFHRGAAYLALVSGAPIVPVTFFGTREAAAGTHTLPPRGGRVDIVYGVPYRTPRASWPRTKRLVEATSLDLRVHMLVALDAARTLTGRDLPGPLPTGRPPEPGVDPSASITPSTGGSP